MPFRINYTDKYTWIAVTDGFNKKLAKKEFNKTYLNIIGLILKLVTISPLKMDV